VQSVRTILILTLKTLTLKQKHARGVTVNANLDNTPPAHIKPPVRMPVEEWDKIMIDIKKGKNNGNNGKRNRKS
jgi:hypothetical protein